MPQPSTGQRKRFSPPPPDETLISTVPSANSSTGTSFLGAAFFLVVVGAGAGAGEGATGAPAPTSRPPLDGPAEADDDEAAWAGAERALDGSEYVRRLGGTHWGTAVSVWDRAEAEDQGDGPDDSELDRAGCGNGLGRMASSISMSIMPGVWGASESVVGDGVDHWVEWCSDDSGCGCRLGGVDVAKCDVLIAGVMPETDDDRGTTSCFWNDGPFGTDPPPAPTRTCDSS